MACAGQRAPSPEAGRIIQAWLRPRLLLSLCSLPALLMAPGGTAAAQATSLKRALPGAVGAACPAIAARPAAPSEAQRRQARQLAAQGQQASIIDDYARARDLYRQAAQLDPTDANTAYYLARAQEAVKNSGEAVKEYCRFLALTPTASESAEVRDRIAALSSSRPTTVPDQALAQFRAGLDQYEKGRLPDAITAFSGTIAQAPDWPEPYFNRGVAYQAQGRRGQALEDFERYLQLRPEAEDRSAVVARIDGLRRGMLDPSGALTRGLIIPGFGQYYTRRPVIGALVLAGVGSAVYVALQETTVHTTRIGNFIDYFGKPYQSPVKVIQRERPHLVTGLVAAGGITVAAALEAYFRARADRGDAPAPAPGTRTSTSGLSPLIAPSGSGVALGMQLAWPRPR